MTRKKDKPAFKLLKTLTSPETSALLTKDSGFISNIDMSEIKSEETRLYTMGQELINNASCLAPPPDSIIDRALWEDVVVKSFPAIYSGGEEEIEALWRIIRENN